MHTALGLAVAVLSILGGGTALFFPQAVSHLQEDADTTPEEAVRQVRFGGGFLFLFGWALLHAVLTANGQPAEFIGV
ncbi:MAG TPA: hypothetical protein VGF55_25220 [Gemmataceae bacterium]|jgi:uncharacterized protein YjeT (DUF2065 family)